MAERENLTPWPLSVDGDGALPPDKPRGRFQRSYQGSLRRLRVQCAVESRSAGMLTASGLTASAVRAEGFLRRPGREREVAVRRQPGVAAMFKNHRRSARTEIRLALSVEARGRPGGD